MDVRSHRRGERRRVLTVLLVLGGLGLAACGGDDGAATPATDAVTTTTRDRAADRVHAEHAVLTLPDLPAGWDTSDPDDDASIGDEEYDQAAATCLGIPVEEINSHDEPYVESKFASPTDDEVSSEVTYWATAAEAKADLDQLLGPKVPACLQKALTTGVAVMLAQPGYQGVQVGQVAVTPYALGAIGDSVVSYHVIVPLSGSGGSAALNLDLIGVRKGRAGVSMTFTSSAPIDPKEEARLSTLVVSRLDDT